MRIFKFRLFHQWAKREGIKDSDFKKAIGEIENGLFDANLGNGFYENDQESKANNPA